MSILKPSPILKNGTVSIVSLSDSSVAVNPVELSNIQNWFSKRGYQAKIHPICYQFADGASVTVEERASALEDAFKDKKVDGIFSLRGGNGCIPMLPYIDFSIIANNPKFFCGYCDPSAFSLAAFKECQLVTFHGATAYHFQDQYEGSRKHKARRKNRHLTREKSLEAMNGRLDENLFGDTNIKLLVPGEAEGKLFATHRYVLDEMLNAQSSFLPDFKNSILVIQDYPLDIETWKNSLNKWEKAGVFSNIAGMIIGHLPVVKDKKTLEELQSLAEQLAIDYARQYHFPLIGGAPFGNAHPNLPLPQGINARLDSSSLRLLENPFCKPA